MKQEIGRGETRGKGHIVSHSIYVFIPLFKPLLAESGRIIKPKKIFFAKVEGIEVGAFCLARTATTTVIGPSVKSSHEERQPKHSWKV